MDQQSQENVRGVLAGFEDVWRRVGAPLPKYEIPPPRHEAPGSCGTLARLASDAARISAWDRALSRRFTGSTRSKLISRASESRKLYARLSAEFFLLCGERLRPEPAPGLPRDTLSALRASMQADEAAAISLDAAVNRLPPELSGLLSGGADQYRSAAEEKRGLILRYFR